MRKRIIADVFVFCLFLWAPWQLTAAFVIIFLIYFPNYWEGAALALVADSFYSLPGRFWMSGFGFLTLSSLLIIYISSIIKNKIKITLF